MATANIVCTRTFTNRFMIMLSFYCLLQSQFQITIVIITRSCISGVSVPVANNGTLFTMSYDPSYWRKRPTQNGTYCQDIAAVTVRDVGPAASADNR